MYRITALYHFARLDDPAALRAPLLALCESEDVRGTLLLAREGINGTISGSCESVTRILDHLRALPGCADLAWKDSHSATPPFGRMKVRVKREIVTMGVADVDPRAATGHYVAPAEWNALIAAPDVAVIDTRNAYEVAIGSFEGAVDPGTDSFRDFPGWWQANKGRFHNKRVAMFCTGGIRCEKATNFVLGQGVEDVFHLKGGILKYLERVPEAQSLWRGECFVFDERVSLGHGLRPGRHELCRACRRPLAPQDRNRPEYERGVACHRCAHEHSPAQRGRFRERQRQIDLARARGQTHLGTGRG